VDWSAGEGRSFGNGRWGDRFSSSGFADRFGVFGGGFGGIRR